jgi:hypothetical protein
MDLCKYSNIFGAPNTGAHKYRFFDIAIVDVIATIILGVFIKSYFLKKTNIFKIMLFLFILGIISHRVFCVKTKIDSLLFG